MENAASASGSSPFLGCPPVVRILVVEEDPICLTNLTQILQGSGYEVTAKESPEEALKEVRLNPEGSFDLVMAVAHTRGAGIDGFAILDHLKDRLPVILFSDPEPMNTVRRAIDGGARGFLTKPLRAHDVRYIWQHVARWRFSADTDSDPGNRGPAPARAAKGSGEGRRSYGVQQQQTRYCGTTRRTNTNSPPSDLHAAFVEAAEMLRGTEGYCPRGISELLVAQDVEVTIEQATSFLEMYERDSLTKELSAMPTAISPHYNSSKNHLTPGSSGSCIRSQGATNIDQTSLLISNGASPVGHGALGNESYSASHAGHLHNNGNHHGNSTCYGNHNVPANGSMASASPSYYNLAHQVQQAMPTNGLYMTHTMNDPTMHQAFPKTSRLSYNSTTGGISMSPWPVPMDNGDLLRSYLRGDNEVMQNTAATGMTQGMHGGAAAGQTSAWHPQEHTGFFSWETTNGNGTASTSGGSMGIETDGMDYDSSEDELDILI